MEQNPQTRRIRTAVIGLGRIGWEFHLPQVAAHREFELVAVVDPLAERRDEAHDRFGAPGYPRLEDLYRDTSPDLIVIASPTRLHADHAVCAFEHGSHVFCDKPLAASLAEADRMVSAMRRHGRKLMAYQPQRGTSETVALLYILAADLIGPVYMIKRSNTNFVRRNDWQAFRKHSGGMLNNYGSHLIDQLLYVSGSRARRVTCRLRSIASLGDADDVARVLIEAENRIILDIDINQAAAFSPPLWQVCGSRGTAVLNDRGGAWHVRYFRPNDLPPTSVNDDLAAPGREYPSDDDIPWRDEEFSLSDFPEIDYYRKCYEYFAEDAAPFIPIEESRELIRILEACRSDDAG